MKHVGKGAGLAWVLMGVAILVVLASQLMVASVKQETVAVGLGESLSLGSDGAVKVVDVSSEAVMLRVTLSDGVQSTAVLQVGQLLPLPSNVLQLVSTDRDAGRVVFKLMSSTSQADPQTAAAAVEKAKRRFAESYPAWDAYGFPVAATVHGDLVYVESHGVYSTPAGDFRMAAVLVTDFDGNVLADYSTA